MAVCRHIALAIEAVSASLELVMDKLLRLARKTEGRRRTNAPDTQLVVEPERKLVWFIFRRQKGKPVEGLPASDDLGGVGWVAGIANEVGSICATELEVDGGDGQVVGRLVLADGKVGNVNVLVGVWVRGLRKGRGEASKESGDGGKRLHGDLIVCC